MRTMLCAAGAAVLLYNAPAHAEGGTAALADQMKGVKAAVQKAVKTNKGYRALSVTPSMRDGHPSAEVTLLKGSETKSVTEPLD